MDPEITGLAATAGTTLVTLLATDAWQGARDGVVALWRRTHPDRADAIGGELDASREELVSAQTNGDAETEAELRADWQGRLRQLLTTRPELAEELRALLAEFPADTPTPTPTPTPPPTSPPLPHARTNEHADADADADAHADVRVEDR